MFPSPSLAGWGRWRPRGIQRTSRATLCKQQQRFPHAQVPPHPASCTGPAIPASLHTLQGSSLQGSICSGCTENPAPHLQQLCEEGLSHPPLQLHRAALKLHLRVVNPASRKAVLFSLFFFFFFPTRHFPGSPLELGGEERRTAQLIPAAGLPLPQPEKKSSPWCLQTSLHPPSVHLLAPKSHPSAAAAATSGLPGCEGQKDGGRFPCRTTSAALPASRRSREPGGCRQETQASGFTSPPRCPAVRSPNPWLCTNGLLAAAPAATRSQSIAQHPAYRRYTLLPTFAPIPGEQDPPETGFVPPRAAGKQ